MEVLKELLSKYWTLYENNPKFNEQHIALELGYSLTINNIKLINHTDDNQLILKALELYERTFQYKPREIMQFPQAELINPLNYDLLGRVYEEHIHKNGTRKKSGQFYTPIEVVNYMIDFLKLTEVKDIKKKKFIDIACGTGIFLLKIADTLISIYKNENLTTKDIVELVCNNIYGLDINSTSCLITKINLINLFIIRLGSDFLNYTNQLKLNIFNTNSIENRTDLLNKEELEIVEIKNRIGKYKDGFDYIVGNPPYLEAKRMPKELKEILKSNYPEMIYGAFDLYIGFIAQCNRLISDNGTVSLILPNKFTVAKYAIPIRKYLNDKMTIIEIVDLSEMDIFHKADVYPIIISYKNTSPTKEHKVSTKISVKNYSQLIDKKSICYLPQSLYKEIGNMNTFFCLPPQGDFQELIENLFKIGEPIGNYLEFRSTVSFHKKGLREQYVSNSFKHGDSIKKYLGGKSFSKKNEVQKYKIDWEGYYINYDQESLQKLGNKLPPLDNFERSKIIFCQHARVITATFDEKGEWVTKDVFPIAFESSKLPDSPFSLKYFTGLLNSSFYSFLYGIIYKGIQISAGYYHYLPTWMSILPVINLNKEYIKRIEQLVDKALSSSDDKERQLIIEEIDQVVFNAHSINQQQQELIMDFIGVN